LGNRVGYKLIRGVGRGVNGKFNKFALSLTDRAGIVFAVLLITDAEVERECLDLI